MPRLLHLVLNDFTNDNRVRRAAECGRDAGYEVAVFALATPVLKGVAKRDGIAINRFDLRTRSLPKTKGMQILKYAELFFRALFSGIKYRPHVVHAHDVDALPIGWAISAICGSHLIYDAHELWADPAHAAVMPKWLFWGLRQIEKNLSRRADDCITVSSSIANHMTASYNLRHVHVVRNVPERWVIASKMLLRESLGIPTDTTVILYQGAIGGEGVYTLAKAFRKVSGNAVLVYLGNGPATPELQIQLSDLGERVRFHPFVKSEDLPLYSSDADIGVHPMADGYLNHQWALPNKFFEYIQAGLALVVSDLPEMRRVVDEFAVGKTVPAGDTDALAAVLQSLVDDNKTIDQFKLHSRHAAEHLNWGIEKQQLDDIYKRVKHDSPIQA